MSVLTFNDVLETTQMITHHNLDVRTITMGISLRDCGHPDVKVCADKIYDKITKKAEKLVQTGEDIESDLGVPIINKRISVTPISMVGESCDTNDYVPLAKALDKAAHEVGVNFIGGFSALVDKGYTKGDRNLIASIPEALATTDVVCSSVNVGSTKAGINMDAVAEMGRVVKETAEKTAANDAIGCAKLVVFCNAVNDNPFMAGAFHGVTEPESVVSVGVSGPGVVKHALEAVRGQDIGAVAEVIKRTAFKITRVGQLVAQEAAKRLNTQFGIIDLSRSAYFRRNRSGKLRRPRYHGNPCHAERRGEKGRADGVQLCGRSVRRLYSRQRGRGHDCGGRTRQPVPGKTGSHDLRLLRWSGHDRHSRRHYGRNHCGHYCGRIRYRHDQQQDHGGSRHSCSGERRGRDCGIRRSVGTCAHHGSQPV